MVFFVLNAIHISKVPGHYINRKIQYTTARASLSTVLSIFCSPFLMRGTENMCFYISQFDTDS